MGFEAEHPYCSGGSVAERGLPPTAGTHGRFSSGFLLSGRKAEVWGVGWRGGGLVVVVVSGFCFVPFQERGLQMGIVSATVCGTVLQITKKDSQNTEPQPSSKFPVNTAFLGRIKL